MQNNPQEREGQLKELSLLAFNTIYPAVNPKSVDFLIITMKRKNDSFHTIRVFPFHDTPDEVWKPYKNACYRKTLKETHEKALVSIAEEPGCRQDNISDCVT